MQFVSKIYIYISQISCDYKRKEKKKYDFYSNVYLDSLCSLYLDYLIRKIYATVQMRSLFKHYPIQLPVSPKLKNEEQEVFF